MQAAAQQVDRENRLLIRLLETRFGFGVISIGQYLSGNDSAIGVYTKTALEPEDGFVSTVPPKLPLALPPRLLAIAKAGEPVAKAGFGTPGRTNGQGKGRRAMEAVHQSASARHLCWSPPVEPISTDIPNAGRASLTSPDLDELSLKHLPLNCCFGDSSCERGHTPACRHSSPESQSVGPYTTSGQNNNHSREADDNIYARGDFDTSAGKSSGTTSREETNTSAGIDDISSDTQIPDPSSKQTQTTYAGETSCEEAASIIASLRGHHNDAPDEVWSELGCGSRQSCRVKNLSVFELMDR